MDAGLFMATQEKVVACGTTLTVFGMVLRFIAGPAAMAIGAIAVGLRGDVLHIAIIQVNILNYNCRRRIGFHHLIKSNTNLT